MRVALGLLILLTGWLGSSPASAFDCAKAFQPTDFVLCSTPKLLAVADMHATAWSAAMTILDRMDRLGLAATQKIWAQDVAELCRLPEHGKPTDSEIAGAGSCVEWEFQRRTETLRKFVITRAAPDETIQHWNVPPYDLYLREAGQGGDISVLWLLKDGHLVYLTGNTVLHLNPRGSFEQIEDFRESVRPFRVGEDILGLGGPALMVEGNSLGAHCCLELTVLILGEGFKALPRLNLLDNEVVQVVPRVEKPASLELEDFTWGYWRSGFAGSSAPPVVLGYDAGAGRFIADRELMRKPMPPAEALTALLREAKAEAADEDHFPDDVPRGITQPILELIYSGHLREAHDFLVAAWPEEEEGRDEYWSDLTTCQMRLSPYWRTVADLNGIPADNPVGQCPRPAKY